MFLYLVLSIIFSRTEIIPSKRESIKVWIASKIIASQLFKPLTVSLPLGKVWSTGKEGFQYDMNAVPLAVILVVSVIALILVLIAIGRGGHLHGLL